MKEKIHRILIDFYLSIVYDNIAKYGIPKLMLGKVPLFGITFK